MKILATFIICLTLCSFTFNKKAMKLNAEKANTNSAIKSNSKNKSDPGAILPAAAVKK